ncbi:tripartite motif-containing protein 16-like protein isoform X3 [Erpetoichthys calabaricus]|uniref:tripartite motif-containing protein 16-like protein isoform X3 n=1 Tax=Erpetoichthys calabaricus TaxID=27687 RepID=UPI002234CF57|nr:tripartite motif-containing protein 16-like protein isoform X3 [Erpetoichthys calabaricus]
MAEAQLLVSEDEFTCSVCLDTLTDPVSISCGHSFCLKCLTDYWDQSQVCRCPQCREMFTVRPALRRNTLLNEVIKKLKKTAVSPSPPPLSQNYAGLEDVECDACTGKKFKAVKSCLTCMASFCQTHLQPHYEGDALKHHKLTDPDGNLKEKLCAKHQKSLEIFCKTDETYICMMCVVTGHKNHEMVELETQREEKEKLLRVTLSDIRRRLEQREKKLRETRRVMEQKKISVEGEVEENEKSFTDLMHCIEEAQKKLVEKIREQEKREIEKAEGVMEQLEKEIEELKKIYAELEELSEIKDNVHFQQTFPSCRVLPADGDSLSFTVIANVSSEDLRKELSCVKKILEKITQWDIMTLTSGREAPVLTLQPPEPRRRDEFLQYFCPLTLDINTAHKDLHLSEGNKKVTCERTQPEYPDHPDRFDYWEQVLCREALTGTRSYWEVECTGDWVLIGVAYKGLSRKGKDLECSFGSNNKSWSLLCADSQYAVRHNDEETEISAPYSPRIGVYLDWPAGSLSFYSVSHTMTLLHRFNTSFTEPLYPGFGFWLDCKSSAKICHLTPCDH